MDFVSCFLVIGMTQLWTYIYRFMAAIIQYAIQWLKYIHIGMDAED